MKVIVAKSDRDDIPNEIHLISENDEEDIRLKEFNEDHMKKRKLFKVFGNHLLIASGGVNGETAIEEFMIAISEYLDHPKTNHLIQDEKGNEWQVILKQTKREGVEINEFQEYIKAHPGCTEDRQ